MDAFKDFFSELKDRFTNPFFGSFIISWLMVNYPIPVTLVFYKSAELKSDGYTSYLNVIEKHLNFWYMGLIPFLWACVYTFLYPQAKRFITVYLAKVTLQTDNEIDSASGDSTVNMDKYLSIQKKYKEQKSELAELLGQENIFKLENESLKGEQINTSNFHLEQTKLLNDQHASTVNQNKVLADIALKNMKDKTDQEIAILKDQNKNLSISYENQVSAITDNFNKEKESWNRTVTSLNTTISSKNELLEREIKEHVSTRELLELNVEESSKLESNFSRYRKWVDKSEVGKGTLAKLETLVKNNDGDALVSEPNNEHLLDIIKNLKNLSFQIDRLKE